MTFFSLEQHTNLSEKLVDTDLYIHGCEAKQHHESKMEWIHQD